MKILGRFLFLAALLLAGCSSYYSNVEPGRSARKYERFWVKTNLNDNHGTDARIARALQARGVQAEYGHLTMMPAKTQVIVTFDDSWTWDFRTHLAYLKISLQDTKSEQAFASATFNGPAAMTASLDDVIDRLVDDLLNPKAPKKK